jgi:NADH-quinone oxidoreductase subunit G
VQLAVASARPSALDVNARVVARLAPGGEARFLADLASELNGEARNDLAKLLRDGGEDVVVVWGERIGREAAALLPRIAAALRLADRPGAGLLEIPVAANGRGLREVGALPNAGPGYAEAPAGRFADEIGRAARDGEITALHLFQIDPIRELPDRATWEQALHRAGLVVAHASVLTDGLREHANVVFPAESYAEKEGTVVHPDGRIQRLRMGIAHPGEVRAGWWVIAEIAKRCGLDMGVLTSGMAWRQLAEAVPFYEALTLDLIGGRGVRWPEREQASALPVPEPPAAGALPGTGAPEPGVSISAGVSVAPDAANGALRLGTYRPIWAAPEVEASPALHFTIARQLVELSPQDARRLGVAEGDPVVVSQLDDSGAAQSGEAGSRAGGKPEGARLNGEAHVRTGVPAGTAFLADGIAEGSANALTEPRVEVRKP